MTKKITDLEGRLDAAYERADKSIANTPHDCGDNSCQDCLTNRALARALEELKKRTEQRDEALFALKRIASLPEQDSYGWTVDEAWIQAAGIARTALE